MTSENKAKLKNLQSLHRMATWAAEYLNKKADECTDETRRAVLIELAETAEAESEKYFAEEKPLWSEYFEEVVANNPDNPLTKDYLAKYSA